MLSELTRGIKIIRRINFKDLTCLRVKLLNLGVQENYYKEQHT